MFKGPEDLVNVDMVLTAIDDVVASREISDMCRRLRVPINSADNPALCDFYFGSQIRDGPLQIMISTNGQSPKLANLIRKRIEQHLPKCAGKAIERVGTLRMLLKERAPGVGGVVGKERMKWMVDVCTSWKMEDLAALDDTTIKKLLDEGWEKKRVPKFEQIVGKRRRLLTTLPTPPLLGPPILAFIGGAACAALIYLAHLRN